MRSQAIAAWLAAGSVFLVPEPVFAAYVGARAVSVTASAGVGGFTAGVNPSSRVGPAWSVQAAVRPWPSVAFEGGYEGSYSPLSQPVGVLGRSDGGLLRGTVAFGVNAGPTLGALRPFVGAGLGGGVVTYTGAEGFLPRDLVAEVPLSVGFGFDRGWATGGLRATYRLLVHENFEDAFGMGPGQGGFLSVAATLGGRF